MYIILAVIVNCKSMLVLILPRG